MDLQQRVLVVRRQIVEVGSGVVVSKPKTRSGEDRAVDLDAGTVFVLRVWRARQEQERTRTDAKDSGYVFTGPDGHHWNPVYVTHHFRQLVQAAGLPRRRLHDLRHLACGCQKLGHATRPAYIRGSLRRSGRVE